MRACAPRSPPGVNVALILFIDFNARSLLFRPLVLVSPPPRRYRAAMRVVSALVLNEAQPCVAEQCLKGKECAHATISARSNAIVGKKIMCVRFAEGASEEVCNMRIDTVAVRLQRQASVVLLLAPPKAFVRTLSSFQQSHAWILPCTSHQLPKPHRHRSWCEYRWYASAQGVRKNWAPRRETGMNLLGRGSACAPS